MGKRLDVRVQIPARICLTVGVEKPEGSYSETQERELIRSAVREQVEELLKQLPELEEGWELADLTGLIGEPEPCMVLYGPAEGEESQPRKGEVQILDILEEYEA